MAEASSTTVTNPVVVEAEATYQLGESAVPPLSTKIIIPVTASNGCVAPVFECPFCTDSFDASTMVMWSAAAVSGSWSPGLTDGPINQQFFAQTMTITRATKNSFVT
jgi:hypothetical protein